VNSELFTKASPVRLLVITSISHQDSIQIRKLAEFLDRFNLKAIVVADKKTPVWENEKNFIFLSVEEQLDLWPKLASLLPWNHYARKNLGYLKALDLKVDSLLDTDDDNLPIANPWEYKFDFVRSLSETSWVNVYRLFGQEFLWPRGFPLQYVNQDISDFRLESFPGQVDCFQSLVDGDPDIDAIGRLLYPAKVMFSEKIPVLLNSAVCPTNSQATVWSAWTIPLLYLPSSVSFRMTDIWRGLIIQSAFRKFNGVTIFGKLGFHQERNIHNLLDDFELEVVGHLKSVKLQERSDAHWMSTVSSKDSNSLVESLYRLYEILAREKFISLHELDILEEWQKLF
jgi:hypothetical protein